MERSADGRLGVRLATEDGRWPLDRTIEVLGQRETGQPRLDTNDNAVRECSVDGDNVWLLFTAFDDGPRGERALWSAKVNLADATSSPPGEIAGSRAAVVDARIAVEGDNVAVAASVAVGESRCNVLAWQGNGRGVDAPRTAGTELPCGATPMSSHYTDGFGFALSSAPLFAFTSFGSRSTMQGRVLTNYHWLEEWMKGG